MLKKLWRKFLLKQMRKNGLAVMIDFGNKTIFKEFKIDNQEWYSLKLNFRLNNDELFVDEPKIYLEGSIK